MNAKNLIAAVTMFAAAGAALADSTYPYVEFTNVAGTKTRAEVANELKSAQASGELARRTEYVEHTQVASGKTRAEVRAELEQAYAEGRYASTNPEFVEFTAVASTRTRDEVRKEAIQAARKKDALIGG
ncbi:MAG TPA: DUF4148 domain-containing protein [Noviherbaspirillum sp.]